MTRRGFVLALGLLASGCTQSYRVGDRVLVEWDGGKDPYPASILQLEAPGRYRVHFEGYESIWDESVPTMRIKGKVTGHVVPPPPPAKVVRARPGANSKTPVSTFKQGDHVKVEWKGPFYSATILEVLGNERYRIHYDGYDDNWNETVDISRIQRR